jgi:hypothetical protein
MPKIHRPLAIAAGLALAVGGLGAGVAFAATGSHAPTKPLQPAAVTKVVTKAPAAVAPATTTDGDNIQEGDQTTPDTGTAAAESSTETPETGTETEGASDGPGGHADPAGNVDHQFEGTE